MGEVKLHANIWMFPENSGFSPNHPFFHQGFSIIFTIHFGGNSPIFGNPKNGSFEAFPLWGNSRPFLGEKWDNDGEWPGLSFGLISKLGEMWHWGVVTLKFPWYVWGIRGCVLFFFGHRHVDGIHVSSGFPSLLRANAMKPSKSWSCKINDDSKWTHFECHGFEWHGLNGRKLRRFKWPRITAMEWTLVQFGELVWFTWLEQNHRYKSSKFSKKKTHKNHRCPLPWLVEKE